MKKDREAMVWGTLREKGWLRTMVSKRAPADALVFLESYMTAFPLRQDWGQVDPTIIKPYTQRLIREYEMKVGGDNGDNPRL